MNINGYTSLYGIVANPIKHSISPLMHNHAFEYLGINSVYMAFEINRHELEAFIQSVKTLGIKGFNVSMPFKEQIIPYLDELSEEAKIVQAVNTVKYEDGKLIGHISDGEGFVLSCLNKGWNIKDKKFVVLGAGGAAKSIIVSLLRHGAKKIVVYNRSHKDFINKIKEEFNADIILKNINSKHELEEDLKDAYMLINTTSVGMNKDDECLVDSSYLCSHIKVYDIIYKPLETKLLKYAREKNLEYSNGIDMLVYQGAISFKYWTNQDMPIDLVINKIRGELL